MWYQRRKASQAANEATVAEGAAEAKPKRSTQPKGAGGKFVKAAAADGQT